MVIVVVDKLFFLHLELLLLHIPFLVVAVVCCIWRASEMSETLFSHVYGSLIYIFICTYVSF